MAKFYDSLSPELTAFIAAQKMFFVASAPLTAEGHVNVSPRGYDCLRILSPNRAAWLDLTGSGNETSAHVTENGRLTLMFCAFEGAPRILRLFGTGRVVLPAHADWGDLFAHFPALAGARQIIVLDIEQVQTSCGFGVPLFDFVGQRDTLVKWAETKGEEGLRDYWCEKNAVSLDGLATPLGEAVSKPE